jgi:hypothetical protein
MYVQTSRVISPKGAEAKTIALRATNTVPLSSEKTLELRLDLVRKFHMTWIEADRRTSKMETKDISEWPS